MLYLTLSDHDQFALSIQEPLDQPWARYLEGPGDRPGQIYYELDVYGPESLDCTAASARLVRSTPIYFYCKDRVALIEFRRRYPITTQEVRLP